MVIIFINFKFNVLFEMKREEVKKLKIIKNK